MIPYTRGSNIFLIAYHQFCLRDLNPSAALSKLRRRGGSRNSHPFGSADSPDPYHRPGNYQLLPEIPVSRNLLSPGCPAFRMVQDCHRLWLELPGLPPLRTKRSRVRGAPEDRRHRCFSGNSLCRRPGDPVFISPEFAGAQRSCHTDALPCGA